MPESENPVIVALQKVFGPAVKASERWPPVLAFGVPAIVAVLLIAVLSPFLSTGVLLLVAVVILMILVSYVTVVIVERGTGSHADKGHPRPNATIDHPIANESVDRTIFCTGIATGIQKNMHLWLAVETYNKKVRIWPKAEVLLDELDHWNKTIFEDGATQQFSISLWIADPVGDKIIRDWLAAGRLKGEYTNLNTINGADRLIRVEGLTLKVIDVNKEEHRIGVT